MNVAAAGALLATAAVHPGPPAADLTPHACAPGVSWCHPGGYDSPDVTAKRWQGEQIKTLSRGHDCISPAQFPKGQIPKSLIVHGATKDVGVEKRVPFDSGFKAAQQKKVWVDRACAS